MKTGTGKHKSVTFNHGKPTKPKSGSSRSIRTINPMMRTKERRSPRTTCSEGPRGAGSTEWGALTRGAREQGARNRGAQRGEHSVVTTGRGARRGERLDFSGEGELRTHVPRTWARLRPQGSVPEVCGSAGCSQAGFCSPAGGRRLLTPPARAAPTSRRCLDQSVCSGDRRFSSTSPSTGPTVDAPPRGDPNHTALAAAVCLHRRP